ncbi:dTMP kinase [Gluconacetobacter johannae]|uniref:Thymidylate kinase n=1 Tax=Gluconacetobacter johannae TaxID=112140 RepID=A0A7W4J6X9_9PROT|nr:dTMP kinase [Gluconacetobacter johannae]MBB2175729.1 dTMP kinase [Gluconacetobacter johannae]
MPGLFITFEGGEGAGKSTQARLLEAHLRAAGHDVARTREPGGTPGAEALRDFLLFGGHDLSLRAEIMVHFAARCDHVDRLIRPALDRGQVVICDRFVDSTLAYQGYGLGQGDPQILDLIQALGARMGVVPDMTFVLGLPRTRALARLTARGQRSDRYEAADEAFHARVADGFDAIARAAPGRCLPIPADRPADAVARDIAARVDACLASRSGPA